MPTRYLKPGIRDSESIDSVSPQAECLFYRLLVTVDDFGRFDARPSMIKASCFPIKEELSAAQCADLLNELVSSGLIVAYSVDGKPYLQMRKWDNEPRAKASKYPAVEDGCIQVHASARTARTLLPVTVTETGNREPETETGNRNRVRPASQAKPRAPKETGQSASAETWDAYSQAYAQRYAVNPVRNAAINGQVANFVARVGAEEAPHVAAFFLTHNGAFYVRAGHAVGAMLKDAEKLRTEWATRRQITSTHAQQTDKTQANFDAFAPLLEKARREAEQQTQPTPEGAHHAE
jgi:hypothetical protein